MKKSLAAVLAALLAAGLCGCGEAMRGIGEQLAVRAVYLEKEDGFEARILALEPVPSADAGEAGAVCLCLAGQGDTVYEAIQTAEAGDPRPLFYGQNELVFIGPNLRAEGLFDACRFLARTATGRPNMAVFGLELDPAGFSALQDNGLDFLDSVRQLEQRGVYKTWLYRFEAPGENGILPVLSAREGQAAFECLVLYSGGEPAAGWRGAKAQLARLLAGQAGALDLTLEPLQVSFSLRSPKLRFEVRRAGGSLALDARLTGTIQQLVGPEGAALPGQDREQEGAIDRAVEQLLRELAAETLGQGCDVFRLGAYFANYDEATAKRMAGGGAIAEPEAVSFACLLRMV